MESRVRQRRNGHIPLAIGCVQAFWVVSSPPSLHCSRLTDSYHRTLQPRDFNLRPNVHATRQSKCGAPRPERLSASFYQLLLACLDPARPTSHRSFSLEWMLALITTHPPDAASPDIQTSLATFFREFIARDSFKELCENAVDIDEVDKLQRVLERDPAAHCFIHHLAAAPDGVRTTNLSTVISHILHVLHIVRPTIPLGDEQAPLLKLYPDLRDSPVQSHTLPFLCFLVLLTWKSKVAVGVCVEVGLLETLDRIILRYPNDAMMNNVYGATLATMSRHAPVVQRIRMFAMWRSSYSSEQEFASMAEAFAATGVSDPAPDSRARTLSFETTSTTTLPSAHGHRLMGAVVSDQALSQSKLYASTSAVITDSIFSVQSETNTSRARRRRVSRDTTRRHFTQVHREGGELRRSRRRRRRSLYVRCCQHRHRPFDEEEDTTRVEASRGGTSRTFGPYHSPILQTGRR